MNPRDELADLHAEQDPRVLHERALSDPDAAAYFAELDATVATLRAHAADSSVSATMPPDVADRMFQSLLTAPPPAVNVPTSRWRARGVMLAAAAAAVVALGTGAGLALAAIGAGSNDDQVVASAPTLNERTVMSLIGSSDSGRLSDPSLLAGCLEANGLPATTTLVGSGRVSLDGVDATLLVTGSGTPGGLIALAVGDRCGPGNADTVSRAVIG